MLYEYYLPPNATQIGGLFRDLWCFEKFVLYVQYSTSKSENAAGNFLILLKYMELQSSWIFQIASHKLYQLE